MKYIKSAATYQVKTMMVIPESALCFVCDYKASIKSFISGSHYLFKRNSLSLSLKFSLPLLKWFSPSLEKKAGVLDSLTL